MQIRNFVKESYIDYPKKLCSVVFSPGCNYACPAGHCKHLLEKGINIDNELFFDYLDSRKGWIDGVVLCGGEPTLQMGLEDFVRKIKQMGFPVKLDTNGSNPSVLMELKQENLIDYIAMDVKGPTNLYPKIVGKDYIDFRDEVEKGMVLATQFPHYEFRTTIVPVKRDDNKSSFMKVKEVVDIAKWIVKRTGSDEHKYYLQPFVVPKDGGKLVDSRLEEFPETPKKLLEEMKSEVIKYLPNCKIR
jgi:pyruvate formate lyase activating enzyme